MSNLSIGVLNVYFGKLPDYFPVWLESCKKNPTIDFIVVTDQEACWSIPNVKFIQSTLEKVKVRASEKLGFEVTMDTPFKLCDYKPAYGVIFEDLLKTYDYWGHCDIDLIWGDLRSFFDRYHLEEYDKFLPLGHLSLYRNTYENNRRFMGTAEGFSGYKEIFQRKQNYLFDELALIRIYEDYPFFDKIIFADILPFKKRYIMCTKLSYCQSIYTEFSKRCKPVNFKKQIFTWINGKIYQYYIEGKQVKRREFLYIHMQKRPWRLTGEFSETMILSQNRVFSAQTIEGRIPQIIEKYNKYSLLKNFGEDVLRFLQHCWDYFKRKIIKTEEQKVTMEKHKNLQNRSKFMLHDNKQKTCRGLFGINVFVLLISRMLVLTDNYNWYISPVTLEIIYLFLTVLIVIVGNDGKISLFRRNQAVVLGILLLHTILWGAVFVDARMSQVVTVHYKSQIMFVVILLVTIWAVQQLQAERLFYNCGYYALSLMLVIQLITNFSEVDLSNLQNVFTAAERTRANFGFGHYNALGAACVCVILLRELVKRQGRTIFQKAIDCLVLLVALIMLLCSASRSAITGLLLFLILCYGARIDYLRIQPAAIKIIKVIGILSLGILLVWALFGLDTQAFLVVAQRALLFTHTLPMFFRTGKVLLGLGYANNAAYATQQTPYLTYWMDNAYVYYLVATGIVGLSLLIIACLIIGKSLHKKRKTQMGRIVFAAFLVYLYISLFEATLFNSGGLVNYIYLPWFLLGMSEKNGREAFSDKRRAAL